MICFSPLTIDIAKAGRRKKFSWDLDHLDIEIFHEIASGSEGRVLAACYNGLDVAVKVRKSAMNDQKLHDLSREISALADIRHNFIVQFYGITVIKDQDHGIDGLAIVTERCETDLRRWLDEDLSLVLKLQAASQILTGMTYLHFNCGIIHNDLKPENILVDRSGANLCKFVSNF